MRRIEDLIYYSEKKTGLLKNLSLSLKIERFYPEAFQYGTCNVFVTGNPNDTKNIKVRFKRLDENEELIDEISYHPKELPEEILSIPNIKSALISISNKKRFIAKNDHCFHSGISLN